MNVSSIVDLKAELFRKQEELKRQKVVGGDGNYIKGKTAKTTKTSVWSKKNAGVLERAQRDFEEKEEEENIFDRSKKSLEAKAQLYDKICRSSDIPVEDGSGTYLVDFQKKVIDNIVEKRNRDEAEGVQKPHEEPQEEPPTEDESVPPEEQWVDYVDSLGRSRRCMKKDLELNKRDNEFTSKHSTNSSSDIARAPETNTLTLMSSDMKRELLRQKWEQEEQESRNQPIHYSNVRYDEIRNHGVGYYQFSRSEETRQKEMETLDELRGQTLDERTRRERLKEKRKAMLSARLAKVKQRRTMKGGLLGLDGDDKSEEEIGPKLEEILGQTAEKEKAKVEPLTRDDSWRKDLPVREWDKGKESLPIFFAEKYTEERRKERIEEFAPPTFYKDESTSKQCFKTKVKDLRPKQTLTPSTKHEDTVTATTPVTPSEDVSHIPLPPDASKHFTNEDLRTNSVKPQTYGQGLTKLQPFSSGYQLPDSSTDSISQHTPNTYMREEQQIPGTYMQYRLLNDDTGTAQQFCGTYPLSDICLDTKASSDWRAGGDSLPSGYAPTEGSKWTVPSSSAPSLTAGYAPTEGSKWTVPSSSAPSLTAGYAPTEGSKWTVPSSSAPSLTAGYEPTEGSKWTVPSSSAPSLTAGYAPTEGSKWTVPSSSAPSLTAGYKPTEGSKWTVPSSSAPSLTAGYAPTEGSKWTVPSSSAPSLTAGYAPTEGSKWTVPSSSAPSLTAGYEPTEGSNWTVPSSSAPSLTAGYAPTEGSKWTVPSSSAPSLTAQAVNPIITGGTMLQAAYGHGASNVCTIPAASSNTASGPGTTTLSTGGTGSITGGTGSITGFSSDSVNVSQNKKEHVPRIPKMSIVDSRFMQNEMESEPVGVELLASTDMEAVAYEPGSYTEVASWSEGEPSYSAAAAVHGKSNYRGGAVLYTHTSATPSTEHTTEETVNKFLKHIRNETLK